MKYPHLFEPVVVAGTLFRNRIMASPTGHRDTVGCTEHGFYHKDENAVYYERMAIGGAASVTVGSCYIDRQYGDFGTFHVFLDDWFSVNCYNTLAGAVTRHGAVASAEIIHCGLYSNRAAGTPSYGPVDMEDNGRPVYAMDEAFIENVIEKFADAAAFAKRCGFTMATIHGAHGWIISQFVNPKLNTRKDKWGGPSVENRSRLAVEICKAIRRKCGNNFPIDIRISGSECYDGGYGIDEGVAFAKQLDGYADIIHVSAGSHERDEVFTITHPSMFLDEGCNSIYAAEVKKAVKTAKVVTVGAFSDPKLAEEIIASGKADFVAMARQFIADPDYPNKLRAGREDDVIKCMRCLTCFSHTQNFGKLYCAINPKTGRGYGEIFDVPPARKKKILIAGGGIGGMQAALTCAERGHEVILCERSGRLGGGLRCEEKVPFKKNLDRYLNKQESAVSNCKSITLHLNTEVTPESAKSFGADVLIAALGAAAIKPKIKGIDGANVFPAEEIYTAPEKAGGRVIILGGGLVGIELGIFLAGLGKKITVIEMLDKLNDGGNHLHAKGTAVEIKKLGIEINLNTKAVEITDKGVLCETEKKEQKLFEADTVVYAVGQRPLHEEVSALSGICPEFHILGDCVAPRNILAATAAAYDIGRAIGRFGV
ncbi:MAG: FAD-dependent oxidoreductase [Oscillospiraceae bacterium]|nr:FAD-dependent oxidoreductase [Oscillospiraceae bacterium]